ncbi:glycoside hydrolase family 3 C-terminal domain-containing protein [Microbacterium karelineae]|uniref:glycoside hydrolase family 3 C-terminal domain-containing protein n=1 Tax=Microbacterium karelineae TaxID=2654283 RepID=UPI001E34A5FB|nr:glycoside hydrolase family 3 C-terminal domain-containing protein [Microbacterium karelineae]
MTDPLSDLVDEIVDSLTTDEQIAMLHQHNPPIERVGLGAFRTGTEALHGVSWLGDATVFPQPVGLAAAWDPELVRRVGEAASIEVRAKHAADRTVSLNAWAPVVNPLRHPLWGRNEEGFSEDPDVTAELGTAFCRGLRGEDPVIWRTVPTLKHFLGYGNETDRSATSSHLTPQALREYELPAHLPAVASGSAGSVMPSYNLVNGRPAHLSGELLVELRAAAPHEIAVCSDAAAPRFIVSIQRFHATRALANAAALRAGVDSFADDDADSGPTTAALREALDAGHLTADDIRAAARRVLLLRARTGEFTPDRDPYRGIDASAIGVPTHRALAREAAARGVVVLDNDGALPLVEAPATIAVVGPYADHVAHDWYSGTPPYAVSLARALRERYPAARVRTAEGADRIALRDVRSDRYLTVAADGSVTATGERADEAALLDLTEWGDGIVSLRSALTGKLLTGASWILSATAERIGGWVAQETFRLVRHGDGTASMRHVGSGRWLTIQRGGTVAVEGDEHRASRFAVRTVRSGAAQVAAASAAADIVIAAVGNDPHVLGRETEDRPHLALPQQSQEILRAASETGAPVILTIVSSGPFALGAHAERAAAVVWTSHAGQELGHGLVDVLSGDAEPEGRLPQTWWDDPADAGELLDYDLVATNATYRYSRQTPRYAIGHGRGYAAVEYLSLEVAGAVLPAPEPTTRHTPATSATGGAASFDDAIPARVTVRNAGTRPAHELVALWVRAPELPVPAPRVRLAGYARVELAPGETRSVVVPVRPGHLAVWDVGAEPEEGSAVATPGAFVVQPGAYRLTAGPSAAEAAVEARLVVTGPGLHPRRADGLLAHAAHAFDGVVTGPRTPARGGCLVVAAGRATGRARYDRLDLADRASLGLVAAGTGEIVVSARPTGEAAAPWVEIARGAVDAAEWDETVHPLARPLWGGVDLRVSLTAGARLAELTFA